MSPHVVALVPCKNGAASITETIDALLGTGTIARVVVIDDGSKDDTADVAARAGADVVHLPVNRGKGGALRAGIEATPDADIYILVDADTRTSASQVARLLPPVISGEAQLAIGVLPAAGSKGGFGLVRDTAARGIARASRYSTRAPLSGQRAINADLLRSFELAPRFGVEVAMTIDAVKRGATVTEIDVDMDHYHHGKTVGGFMHRARQGWDVVRALQSRVFSSTLRGAALLLSTMVCIGLLLVHSMQSPTGEPSTASTQTLPKASIVQVVLVPGWVWSDYQSTGLPGVLDPTQPLIVGSLATGEVKDLASAVAAGSRNNEKQPAPDVRVDVYDPRAPTRLPDARVRLIAGVPMGGELARLRPIVLQGTNQSGTFLSASSKRKGIVDLTDIAPTVLAMQHGSPPPGTSALRFEPSGPAATAATAATPNREPFSGIVPENGSRFQPNAAAEDEAAAVAERVLFYGENRGEFNFLFLVSQLVIYGAAWLRRNNTKAPRWWAPAAVLIAAVPAASMLTQWFFSDKSPSLVAWSACCVAVLAIIVGMWGRATLGATTGLRRVLMLTMVIIAADVIGNDIVQLGGFFGSTPALGARYYGLGNVASVLLLIATVLWATLHVRVATDIGPAARKRAWWRALVVSLLVAVVIGAPGLGSDVGGLFTSIVTFALLFMALRANTFARKRVILVVGAAVFGLVVAAVVDAQRAAENRTHLGQLAARMGNEGLSPLFDTIVRKVDVNFLGYGFPWSMAIVAAAAAMLAGLLGDRWTGTLPKDSAQTRSPERSGAIAALIGSALAYGVNDSGIVTLVLVAVFLGPFLMVFHRRNRWDIPKVEVLTP